jgi:hypothetical protein
MNAMNAKNNYGLYALAVAIIVVGALAFGLPLASLLWVGVVLACPLMMFFMMRGMGGGSGSGHDSKHDDGHPSDRP